MSSLGSPARMLVAGMDLSTEVLRTSFYSSSDAAQVVCRHRDGVALVARGCQTPRVQGRARL